MLLTIFKIQQYIWEILPLCSSPLVLDMFPMVVSYLSLAKEHAHLDQSPYMQLTPYPLSFGLISALTYSTLLISFELIQFHSNSPYWPLSPILVWVGNHTQHSCFLASALRWPCVGHKMQLLLFPNLVSLETIRYSLEKLSISPKKGQKI